MKRSHRYEMFGRLEKGWLWCLHCERAYRAEEYREIGDLQMCPYEDCDGDTVLDAWPWKQVRGANPSYPREPERGKVYPLYPEKT